jgi:hypothetical protein
MKKFFLVVEWRLIVVEADSQSEAIDRSHELGGPLESPYAQDFKSSRGCRLAQPIEAVDLADAWKKFREGPIAGWI